MEIKWTFPKFNHGYNPPAVYRIDFDNGFFYIGSSEKIKVRIGSWRTLMRRERFPSKMFAENIKGATSGIMQILEITTLDALRDRETFHIRSNFEDLLLLNQSANGYNIGGKQLKPIPKHLQRKKKRKKVTKDVWAFSKGVVQFDLHGNYIKSHRSIADAARSVGVNDSTVQGQLKSDRQKGINGYIFRLCGDNRPIVLCTRTVIEKIVPMIELSSSRSKPVIDLNTGVFYYSAKEAAAQTRYKPKYFYKMISGEIPNKTQYRYAEK
jgi:hypothetical protein